MAAKRKNAERNLAKAGNWAAHEVIERREATKDFVEYAKRIARDKKAAHGVARRAGIITKSGRLTKLYRP